MKKILNNRINSAAKKYVKKQPPKAVCSLPNEQTNAFINGAYTVLKDVQDLVDAIEDYCYTAGGNEIEEHKKKSCREVLLKWQNKYGGGE